MDTGAGQAVNFDTKNGIILGSTSNVLTTIDIICSNATTKAETAVSLDMNLAAYANITMKDFIIWPKVNSVFVANTEVKEDIVGMYAHNYNIMFTNILKNYANNFNMEYSKGWALANLDPRLAMITGVIKDAMVTPYVVDNFMFIGFEMQADLPN